MKNAQSTAQAARLEELIVFLNTTTRELAHLVGVHENTLYKICCGHSSISNRTAARICYNIEKQYGITINRHWLLTGEGSMLNDEATHPTAPYLDDEHPVAMAAEDPEPYGNDWKDKYFALLEKYTELLENKV